MEQSSRVLPMTPFAMALHLRELGLNVPFYPQPLYTPAQALPIEHQRILDLAFLQACEAWEFEVERIYIERFGPAR